MGDMQTEAIINTLLSAARFLKKPIQDVATQSLKDAYQTTRGYLQKKFGAGSEATAALDLATDKPESEARKAVLIEETASAELEADAELDCLIKRLAALLPVRAGAVRQNVHIGGRGNHVLVAGRDIVTTAKHVQRSAITPDERHIPVEQRKKIGVVMTGLAERLADEDGKPNFAAVHRMLQHRFNVASYLLIRREKHEAVLAFLRQQCAVNRSRLYRRNPIAYQNDFFRSIHARREKLGWDKPQLHQFALEKLGLKKPITSLKALGPIQLKSLAEFMQRQVASMTR
ncbi:MAG TPA: hypothetical protein VK717_01640 [Opitutaceae bacterium]|jgi:hypothetical protein|nr:hypothetical protein [Opitutaceae bacterium]